jgi:tripartite-type tricarboxylate transporter receptor subunit TctC
LPRSDCRQRTRDYPFNRVAAFDRNHWPLWIGLGGRLPSESLAALPRNPQLVDTMAGRIQYSFSPVLPALPLVMDGKVLALGVTTAQRSPVLSQVPTVAEAGVPGYEYQDWWGAFAPAKTPRAVIDKIGKDIARVLEPADVVKRMLDQGTEAKPSTPDVFTDFVRAKIEAARKLATLSGIRA